MISDSQWLSTQDSMQVWIQAIIMSYQFGLMETKRLCSCLKLDVHFNCCHSAMFTTISLTDSITVKEIIP